MLDHTTAFWRDWLSKSTYTGRWREMVSRSAMTLKLLTYNPTGAPVAAATAGLPEDPGGERNWDYRFTWVGTARSPSTRMLGLGYTEEAAKFGFWLRDRVTEQAGEKSGPLKIMYRVDGTSDLVEEELKHFEGWRGREAGQDRQRCRRPAAARHLRRGDGRRLPGRPERLLDPAPGLAVRRRDDRLAVRALGPAGRGDLGDQGRPQGLHLRAVPVLGRARPGDQDRRAPRPARAGRPLDHGARPDLQPDHGPRLEPQAQGVHPALRQRRARLVAAADAAAGVHRAA